MTDFIRNLIHWWGDPTGNYPSWVIFNECLKNAGPNSLTGPEVKSGRWEEYFTLPTDILKPNMSYCSSRSSDFGGPLFDFGSGRYSAPPLNGDEIARNFRAAS